MSIRSLAESFKSWIFWPAMEPVTSSIMAISMFSPPLPPMAISALENWLVAVLMSGSLSMLATCRNGVLM